MTTLIAILSLFFLPTNADFAPTLDSHHVGKWDYVVEAPDMTYKGIMELAGDGGEYTGSINSQGVSIPMTDIDIDGDDLMFKMNVQGFPCNVAGSFDGDSFKGTVSVEGMAMPMTAKRAK